MKKKYIKFLFGSALALSLNTQAQTNACNELFISEIVYAKDQIAVSGNSAIDKSYALELFNPKGTDVDLTGYSIKLAQSSGADVSVNLTGMISSKGKFTVAFSGSDAPLTAIANLLKSDLNFEEKTRLELWGPDGLIDRIGQVNLTQADVINITLALADPLNYLNTLNLNLTSLENFTARRKYTENQGDPNFVQPADKWEIAQNGDITNLGVFNNVCSEVQSGYWAFEEGNSASWNEINSLPFTATPHLYDAFCSSASVKVKAVFGPCDGQTSGPLGYSDADASDFNASVSLPYTVNSGSYQISITIPEDGIPENPEYFTLQLYDATCAPISETNGCMVVTIGASTSIKEINKNSPIMFFFNKNNNQLELPNLGNTRLQNLKIYNAIGQNVFSEKVISINSIELSNNVSGVYFITYEMDNTTYSYKLIIK